MQNRINLRDLFGTIITIYTNVSKIQLRFLACDSIEVKAGVPGPHSLSSFSLSLSTKFLVFICKNQNPSKKPRSIIAQWQQPFCWWWRCCGCDAMKNHVSSENKYNHHHRHRHLHLHRHWHHHCYLIWSAKEKTHQPWRRKPIIITTLFTSVSVSFKV